MHSVIVEHIIFITPVFGWSCRTIRRFECCDNFEVMCSPYIVGTYDPNQDIDLVTDHPDYKWP